MDLSSSWKYIVETAKIRYSNNRTQWHVNDYGIDKEVIGVAGEVVARRHLGLDEEVHLGFDGGVDITFCGIRIDVKATLLTPKFTYKFLQWAEGKPIKSDIIFLTAIDPISMAGIPVGYATRDAIGNAPVNKTRHIPCHEIPVRELHPDWELLELGIKFMEDVRCGVSQSQPNLDENVKRCLELFDYFLL